MRKRTALGAATDDPHDIIQRAIRVADGHHGSDSLPLRQAAEAGWLAASSVADVAARHLGMKAPRGRLSRLAVLHALEDRAGFHRGELVTPFGAAQAHLHSYCFHEDVCPLPTIKSTLRAVEEMTRVANKALTKLRGRRG